MPLVRKVKGSGNPFFFFILNLTFAHSPVLMTPNLKTAGKQDEALGFGQNPLYLNGEQTLLPLGLLTR